MRLTMLLCSRANPILHIVFCFHYFTSTIDINVTLNLSLAACTAWREYRPQVLERALSGLDQGALRLNDHERWH